MGRLPWWEDGSVFFTRHSTGVFFTWPCTGVSFDRTSTGVFFTWPCTGVSFARPSNGVFFTWPSLESPLLDPLLESSSLSLPESELLVTDSKSVSQSVSQSVGRSVGRSVCQSVRPGHESLLVCVCVSVVSLTISFIIQKAFILPTGLQELARGEWAKCCEAPTLWSWSNNSSSLPQVFFEVSISVLFSRYSDSG
jgi:hypothetical protein